MEGYSGAHDARVTDTEHHPEGSPDLPTGSPGVGVPTGNGMVKIRGGTTHRSEWVARIVTTGFAGRPGRLAREGWDESTGPKKAVGFTATKHDIRAG